MAPEEKITMGVMTMVRTGSGDIDAVCHWAPTGRTRKASVRRPRKGPFLYSQVVLDQASESQ